MKKRLSGILSNLKEIIDTEAASFLESASLTTSDDQRQDSNRKSQRGNSEKYANYKYPQWVQTVEKKVKTILDSLQSLSKITPAKNKSTLKKVITTTLAETVSLLEVDHFAIEEYTSSINHRYFKTIREILLDLWGHLLDMLERMEESDASHFYKAILLIIRRREFDCSHLSFDVNDKPTCSEIDLQIAQRYRSLLYTSQNFAVTKLSKSGGNLSKSHNLYLFCTKIIAINYFRIKDVETMVLAGISLEPAQKEEFVNILNTEYLIMGGENKPQSNWSVPTLFDWAKYHNALSEKFPGENFDEKLARAPKEWMPLLGKRDILFFVFLREWIFYVRSAIGDHLQQQIPWNSIPGYSQLCLGFLWEFRKIELLSKSVLDTSVALLLTDLSFINFYIKLVFARTNVCSVPAVVDCFANLDVWFKEMKAHSLVLPPNFDSVFFCSGLNMIINTDHHQLLQKTLGFLYNYAELFRGEARKAVYCDMLIKQHFFSLFLHWDDGARNAFQQIIVFKTIRLKRSVLHSKGLVNVEELAYKELGIKKEENDTIMKTEVNEHLSDEDLKENNLDAILFAKIESYVRMVQEQVRDPSQQKYDKDLEVYVPKALSEYKMYMSRYYQWERSGSTELPKLVPMHILNTMSEID